ncbi:hypothetical protein KJ068_11810 [bacterium]|nr:hypothetical protein [bacterium]
MRLAEERHDSLDNFESSARAPGVINIFFDEVHRVINIKLTIYGDYVDLEVVAVLTTLWIARLAPTTRRISLDSSLQWKVKVSSKNACGLEVVSY